MNLDTAKTIVKQFYSNADDPALTQLLDASKSDSDYRPYYVAALFIYSEYRQLIKADEVTFAYDKKYSIDGLLAMQEPLDKGSIIPDGMAIADLQEKLCDACEDSNLLSFSTYGM